LYEHNRWQPLPYEGTLAELVDVTNTDLAPCARLAAACKGLGIETCRPEHRSHADDCRSAGR